MPACCCGAGASLGEQDIAVLTETLFGDAAEEVFVLEGEIRRKYRRSRLSVKVRGIQETGMSVDDFMARYK